jgi:hypothetical protein
MDKSKCRCTCLLAYGQIYELTKRIEGKLLHRKISF